MKKKKGKSILMVVGIIAVAVILANWVVPGVMLAVEANSKLTQADAQALMDQYDGEVSQKEVCRDLVMLRQMSLTPERICGVKEGKIIYEMEVGGLNHQFDVTRSWNGTMYYHSTDDRGGEGTVCIRPWGYTSIY